MLKHICTLSVPILFSSEDNMNSALSRSAETGFMQVFDIHAHIFAPESAARMTAGISAFYSEYALTPHGTGTLENCISQMSAAGITRFALHQVAMRPRMAEAINAFILNAFRRCPDQVVPFAAIHPEQKEPEAFVAAAKAAGFKGFKIHPDMQRFRLDGDNAMPMLRAIEASHLPVLVHCGDRRFDYDGPRRVAALHDRLPDLKAIYAHFGGWSQLEEAVNMLSGRGLLVDLSGTIETLGPSRAADIIRAYGTKNVIFGSDYPMYAPSMAMNCFLRLPLSQAEKADILWNNAERIIGL